MGTKIKILIIDDEKIILDSILKILKHDDEFRIKTASCANEALKIIDSFKPEIILADIMMPDMDGIELLRITKNLHPDIIMTMITGYATINTALQAMQLGAFDYLAKPFTKDELRKVVLRAAELIAASKAAGIKGIVKSNTESGSILESGLQSNIKKNSWMVRQKDGSVLIGVERPFVYNVGEIQTLYLPGKGDEIRKGSVYSQIFSTDLRSQSLFSPLSGIVLEINQAAIDNPIKSLEDPYGTGWLIRINPTNYDEEIKQMR